MKAEIFSMMLVMTQALKDDATTASTGADA